MDGTHPGSVASDVHVWKYNKFTIDICIIIFKASLFPTQPLSVVFRV